MAIFSALISHGLLFTNFFLGLSGIFWLFVLVEPNYRHDTKAAHSLVFTKMRSGELFNMSDFMWTDSLRL